MSEREFCFQTRITEALELQVAARGPCASEVAKALSQDFVSFSVLSVSIPAPPAHSVSLTLTDHPGFLNKRPALQVWRSSSKHVFGFGPTRTVFYPKLQTWTHQEGPAHARRLECSGVEFFAFYEAALNLVLSAIGESLELLGWTRLHGFATRSHETGMRRILLGPSGTGKSSLALQTLMSTQDFIASDEIVLARWNDAGEMFLLPFPLRIAVHADLYRRWLHLSPSLLQDARNFRRLGYREKWLVALPSSRVDRGGPCSTVLRAQWSESRLSGVRALLGLIAVDIGLGMGLPQFGEQMLRVSTTLPRCAFQRTRFALRLLWSFALKRIQVAPWTPPRDAVVHFEKWRASV